MKKNIVIVFVIVLVIGVGGFWLFNKPASKNSSTSLPEVQKSAQSSNTPSSSSDPNVLTIGDPRARVNIVEYADFKCPNCNKFHQSVGKQLRTDFVDKKLVKLEFRNIPFIANDSRIAAEGTYCANDQKKFVDYHDKVFEYMWTNYYSKNDFSKEFSDVLTIDVLTQLAKDAGADGNIFKSCLETKKHKTSVDNDLKKSVQDEVSGTPHIIINGKKIVGPQSYSTYKTLIEIGLR